MGSTQVTVVEDRFLAEEMDETKGKTTRVLAEFTALLKGKEIHIHVSADSRSYRLQVGTRAAVYSSTISQLMRQVGEESLRQALRDHGIDELAKTEKGVFKLCEKVANQLQASYEGFPMARRTWAPPKAKAKARMKEAVQRYCDAHREEGHPTGYLEWLKGFAKYVEDHGVRLCVLPFSDEENKVRKEAKEAERQRRLEEQKA